MGAVRDALEAAGLKADAAEVTAAPARASADKTGSSKVINLNAHPGGDFTGFEF
jgi:hypothetical protein